MNLKSDVNVVTFHSNLGQKSLQMEALIWDIYKLKAGNPLKLNLIGHWYQHLDGKSGWSSETHLPNYEQKLIDRSCCLDQITLKIGVLMVSV